eukprot:gene4843-6036_t
MENPPITDNSNSSVVVVVENNNNCIDSNSNNSQNNNSQQQQQIERRSNSEPMSNPTTGGNSDSIKKTIDDFVIGKVLGEGSYGAVVLGTDRETSIQYAIKILEKKHIIKENKIKYVQIEKEILCRANHPNIVKLFFTFRSDTCLYYVLELCSQGDLLQHIKPVGSFKTSTDSDLWALGCIIYQLSTGKLPFRGKTEFLTFQKVSNREIVYPRNINPVIKDLIENLLVLKPTDRLGSREKGGFAALKSHPFFQGIDWDNLSQQTPPTIVSPSEKIIFDEETPPLTSSSGSGSSGGTPILMSQSNSNNGSPNTSHNNLSNSVSYNNNNIGGGNIASSANPLRGSKEISDRQKWNKFLNPNESILESGLVWKKKGFSIKKRQLILTTGFRLIYIDPKKMEQKGTIPWSTDLKPEIPSGKSNSSNFIIYTPKRKYILEDVEHNPQKWIDSINLALSNYNNNKPV